MIQNSVFTVYKSIARCSSGSTLGVCRLRIPLCLRRGWEETLDHYRGCKEEQFQGYLPKWECLSASTLALLSVFLLFLFCHVSFVLFCVLLHCLMHASVCISFSEAYLYNLWSISTPNVPRLNCDGRQRTTSRFGTSREPNKGGRGNKERWESTNDPRCIWKTHLNVSGGEK